MSLRRRSVVYGLVLALAAGVMAGLPPVPVLAEVSAPGDVSVPVTPWSKQVPPVASMGRATPEAVVWPAGGSGVVAVAASAKTAGPSMVGGLPVRVGAAERAGHTAQTAAGSGVTAGVAARAGEGAGVPASRSVTGPAGQSLARAAQQAAQINVVVAGQAASAAAGVPGVLLQVSRADGGVVPAEVVLDVDVSAFAEAYGGDWSSRLELAAMPSCVLTTPEVPACRRPVAVASSKADPARDRVSAQIVVPARVGAQRWGAALLAGEGEGSGGGEQVYVLSAGDDGKSFGKTSLTSSSSWAAGAQGGEFTWSYPMPVPPVPGNLAPSVGLSYSSGSVDGRTASEGSQTSQVGEGFTDIQPGFIERTYRSCVDDLTQRVSLDGGWNVFARMLPLADWDGDTQSRPDLLGVTTAGDLWVNFNVSRPGDPKKVGATLVSGGWGTITQFWAADADGDGRSDIVGFDGSTVWVWRLTGSPDVAPVVGSPVTASFSGYSKVLAPADLDGDGKPDLAGITSGGELRYRRNLSTSGSVSFASSATLVTSGWSTVQHFFAGDFDGDGRTDLTGRDSDTYYVWRLTGTAGSAPTVSTTALGTGYGVYTRFASLLDYDRDGKVDIAGFAADGGLSVRRNTSTAGSPSVAASAYVSGGWNVVDVVLAADFDKDSAVDLVGRDTSGVLFVWQGTGRPGLVQFGPLFYDSTHDQCWRLPNATMQLGGRSTELVLDDATGGWKSASDAADKVEKVVDANGEHWKVTTTDGTRYFFGLNRLPGWQSADRETKSRLSVPVFANHTDEQCLNSTFITSWCFTPYRWNLDYVVDPHGNTMSYWYGKETANTGLHGNPSVVSGYDRSSYLDHVEYGTRAGTGSTRESAPGAVPQAKVVFEYAERCLAACWSGLPWASAPIPTSWFDTPWDRDCQATSCAGNMSPSFWTARRLVGVSTHTRDAASSTYKEVDRWALAQSFAPTGDTTSPSLWLDSVTHTGKSGTGADITDPPVQFIGTGYANRAHFDAGTEPHYKYRLTNIHNGTGGVIQIYYDPVDCPAGSGGTADPDHNTTRCYPQWFDGAFAWWTKYRVGKVDVSDYIGDQPMVTHTYTYSTAGSSINELWAYNDAGRYSTPGAQRTWSLWRGYSQVTVTTGVDAGQQTETVSRYMRGMNGDRVDDPGTGLRTATVSTTDGVALADDLHLAGFLRETVANAAPGGQALTKTVHDPWWQQTSLRSQLAAWSIPPVTRGGFLRTATSTTKTWLPLSSTWRSARTTTAFDTVYGMPTQADDLGDLATTGDDVCTRTTYNRNTTLWLVQHPSRVETVGVACATTPT